MSVDPSLDEISQHKTAEEGRYEGRLAARRAPGE